MTRSKFWEDRQAEFEKYGDQFPDLNADWCAEHRVWSLRVQGSTRETKWGMVQDPYNVPQQCKDVFSAIARKAVTGLPSTGIIGDAEPWQAWLDFMRESKWGFREGSFITCTLWEWDAGVKDGKSLAQVRRETRYKGDQKVYRRTKGGKLRRLTARELTGKSSEDVAKYYHWLYNGAIEHVFQSSVRFCEALAAEAFELEMAREATRTDVEAIEPQPVKDLQELPPQFQNAFEAVRAKAELEYAARGEQFPNHPHLAERSILQLKRIQDVFFAYCKQARDASRAGQWTAAQTRQHTDAGWPIICDFYFVREHGASSDEARLTFRHAMWRTVADDAQWKQHLSELAAMAEGTCATASDPQRPETAADTVPRVEEATPSRKRRLPATITSPLAARRLEAYIKSNQIGQNEFALQAATTDRTLRKFRQTGEVRRDIFDAIAKAMGTSREGLLKPE